MEHPQDETPGGEPSDPKSYGNISEHHWTRAREDQNQEALDYYRERSKAPGVAQGGGPRNFYCMKCDGVIPTDHGEDVCPHCGTSLDGVSRRYFNWVEIDQPPRSDLRALLPLAAAILALATALISLVLWAVS